MGGINKKEFIKEVLKKLSSGMSFQDAKKEVLSKIGNIESSELFLIEQELINEGISPEEIKRFCNVHALLFEGIFENKISDPSSPSHPINLFKSENKAIKTKTEELKKNIGKSGKDDILKSLEELKSGIYVHYERKEQILFPYLERKGFFGPSKVMWGKDNEVRDLFKKAFDNINFENFEKDYLNPLLEEIDSMIFKEENVLFPTSLEKLEPSDWTEIFKQSASSGYAFIEPPKENFEVQDLNKRSVRSFFEDGKVNFPTGKVSLEELRKLLDCLPVDLTFVDKDGKVAYFSNSSERVFLRTPSVIGREVKNCHPPQSLPAVEKVIEDLKNGIKKYHDFWLNIKGRTVYIRYFPVRDEFGTFMGILEVTQDITEIKKIEGEKRLAS
ncbi:MAG: DUF438 domain-containing protein [Elusimicrobia bacterium]|nr:DUF438 domain-containing protein [Elusimicrobiota bacterium]